MTNQPTLLFSTLFAVTAAGIYSYVGWRLSKRVISSAEARLAWGSFTVWWYGLAATTLIGGLLSLFGALGLTSLPLFVTATYLNILIICLALWGLLYYLIYVFTGNRRSLAPLTAFYVIYYILLLYYITASIPGDVTVGRWNTTIVYRVPLTGPFFIIILFFLLLPQIIGGLAYFSLYFRVSDVTQKYRILLVSWSIVVWFLSPIAALAGGLAQQDWWQLVSRFIGLAAALTILMAYLPPRWLKQRYGIISLGDESTEG
ncbi:MAG TPA: hypothetical protein VMN99_06120 [Anaerolineales bacterium]|nr:hypothetical protein [Anaerolineales bacterium]